MPITEILKDPGEVLNPQNAEHATWFIDLDGVPRIRRSDGSETDLIGPQGAQGPQGPPGSSYTDEMAQDAAGAMVSGNTEDGVTATYDDATNKINFENTDKGSSAVATHEADSDPHPRLGARIAALEAAEPTPTTTVYGTFLVEGATVAWVSGLTFRIGAARYYIDSTEYTSAEQNVTLDAADPSNPRIDVLVLDASGVADSISGTAAIDPAEPSIDPSTYLKVGFVLVESAATEVDVTSTPIWTEDAGSDWTATPNNASIAIASTNNPRSGTKSIEGTNVAAGHRVDFAIDAGSIDLAQQDKHIWYIRPKSAWATKKAVRLQWLAGSTPVGAQVSVGNGQFGFDSQVTGAYQQIVVPSSAFIVPAGTAVTGLRWEIVGAGGSVGFYLDDMSLQAGVASIVASQFRWRGAWDASAAYAQNDAVSRSGVTYLALQSSIGQDPASASAYWEDQGATKSYVDTGLAGKANTSHTHAQADITNLTTDLAAKAPLASPTFTGTPAAPTAAQGTNTTQLATTAFVRAEVAASGGYTDEQAQDAVGTILSDSGDIDFTYDDATPAITGSVKASAAPALVNRNAKWKEGVYACATTNITLSGIQTIGDTDTETGWRILVVGQTDATQNGIYIANDAGAWTRAPDADTPAKLNGCFVPVDFYNTLEDSASIYFHVDKNFPVTTLGVDNVIFARFMGSVAGNLANPAELSDSSPNDGSSEFPSRSDHVHAHGNRGGGSLHAAVVAGGASGFMTGTDKTNHDTLVIREGVGGLLRGPVSLPTATTSVGASTTVLINGTSITIPTGSLKVGNRFRFKINMTKTAGGTAAWQAHVKFGTNNTTGDAAIASWTSGTNTAAIDQCMLHIDVQILTLGAAATARCFAWYNNTLTNATGFGVINPTPTSTATFNSAATSPFLHIDIQTGASAAYTAIGTAEVLA